MHNRLVHKDRKLCLEETAYLPGMAELPYLLSQYKLKMFGLVTITGTSQGVSRLAFELRLAHFQYPPTAMGILVQTRPTWEILLLFVLYVLLQSWHCLTVIVTLVTLICFLIRFWRLICLSLFVVTMFLKFFFASLTFFLLLLFLLFPFTLNVQLEEKCLVSLITMQCC